MAQPSLNSSIVKNDTATFEDLPSATALEDSHFQLPLRRSAINLSDSTALYDTFEEVNFTPDQASDSDSESWQDIATSDAEVNDHAKSKDDTNKKKAVETISKPTDKDVTVLYEAISRGDIETVRANLALVNSSCQADDGLTPLVFAIKKLQFDMARFLLEEGADAHCGDKSLSPMMQASMAAASAPRFIQLLLDHGANPNTVYGPERYNALHHAAANGMVDAVDFLVSKGMDIEKTCSKGRTPLILAAEKGHTLVAKVLLAKGADLYHRNESGGTALLWAASNGHVEAVKYFLDEGIDVDDCDNLGLNALGAASSLGHLEVVKLLLGRCPDVNAVSMELKSTTPIMAAVTAGNTDIVQALIKHNASLSIPNGNGQTLLDVAMIAGHIETVRILLKALGGARYPQDSVSLQIAIASTHATITALMTTASLMFSDLGLKEKVSGGLAWMGWVLDTGGNLVKPYALSNMMHAALVDKKIDIVKELLLHGYDPNKHIPTGHTLLSFAVGQRDAHFVRFLLEAGADPAVPSHDPFGLNYTPLHQALVAFENDKEKDTSVIYALLDSGRCKLMKGDRPESTAFHYVLSQFANGNRGSVETMTVRMLESIKDIHGDRSDDGSTLMHAAVWYGRADLVEMLLTRGASIEATDNQGRTPFLVECGHKTHTLPFLLQKGASPFARDRDDQGALHVAALQGKIDVIGFLLCIGMDIDVLAEHEHTPLTCALLFGQEDAALYLMNRGASIQVKAMRRGRTLLHTAANLNMDRVVDKLLNSGVGDVNARDDMCWTPLALACRKGSISLITKLLDAGADPEAANDCGDRPLHLALIGGNEPIALLLIQRGVDISARGQWDRTPLHLAAGNHKMQATQALIERGASIDALDIDSWTPLHFCSACVYSDPDICQLLIDHKANVNHADSHKRTPLHHAVERGSVDIFTMLLRAGAELKARTNDDGLSVSDMIEMLLDEGLRRAFSDAVETIGIEKRLELRLQKEKQYGLI